MKRKQMWMHCTNRANNRLAASVLNKKQKEIGVVYDYRSSYRGIVDHLLIFRDDRIFAQTKRRASGRRKTSQERVTVRHTLCQKGVFAASDWHGVGLILTAATA
jgi:hypothetical protein